MCPDRQRRQCSGNTQTHRRPRVLPQARRGHCQRHGAAEEVPRPHRELPARVFATRGRARARRAILNPRRLQATSPKCAQDPPVHVPGHYPKHEAMLRPNEVSFQLSDVDFRKIYTNAGLEKAYCHFLICACQLFYLMEELVKQRVILTLCRMFTDKSQLKASLSQTRSDVLRPPRTCCPSSAASSCPAP